MNKQQILFIVAFTAMTQLSSQDRSLATDSYYMAGVVEFRPSINLSPNDRTLENLKNYLGIINSKEAKDLDIIVFPESTLNNNDEAIFVPNPSKELVVPCDSNEEVYHGLLKQLSCAAKKAAMYVVINLTEKEWCSTVPEDTRECAASGLNLFNTNVVFNRLGAIISRYRKVHLFAENKNTTFVPEFGWFDTDFGVRFGHFTCFDILFYSPAQEMAASYGIKDFIFPTMWFSQLPFLTAVQVHQAWSYANDVNFLAAGSSNPLIGSTGSGIYHGRHGILIAKMNQGVGERKLYKAQVPKYKVQHHLKKRSLSLTSTLSAHSRPNIRLKRDYLQSYESVQVNLTSGSTLNRKICFSNTSFCCTFDVKWQPVYTNNESKYYKYRLGVYDGLRNEAAAESNQLKNCAIFSCIGDDIMDCGKLFDINTDVIFENITITAIFPLAKESLIMPNSLTVDMMPLPVAHFEWKEDFEKNKHHVRYELNTPTANILAFSIYGNYYDSVIDNVIVEDRDDGATALTTSLFVLLAISLINTISIF